jgi:hypothetical protein
MDVAFGVGVVGSVGVKVFAGGVPGFSGVDGLQPARTRTHTAARHSMVRMDAPFSMARPLTARRQLRNALGILIGRNPDLRTEDFGRK